MSEILGHVFAPLPLIAVVLGAVLVALAQQGATAIFPAFSSLLPLMGAHPETDRDAARALLLRAEEIAHEHDISRVDRLRARHPFVADALTTLSNAPDAARFAFWARQALSDRTERHQRAIGFWNAVADAAPAMGMGGTIIGLIGMFARMDDPTTIGPAMALALMTTLDGMILANVIAGPIAGRLEALSRRELAWQHEFADRMTALAERDGPHKAEHGHAMREVA